MFPPLPADLSVFVEQMQTFAAKGELDAALNGVANLVSAVISLDDATGEVLGSPALDNLCIDLGQIGMPPATTARKGTVIVATGLMRTGGHTRLVADLALAETMRPVTVIVTNQRHDLTLADVTGLLPAATDVLIAPRGNAAQSLRWLQASLARLNPARTYALQHHWDAVAIAALQPNLTGDLFFLHHADYTLCLGIHLSHALHVDFHAKGFWHCRDHEGLVANQWWPLPVQTNGATSRVDVRRDGPWRTCCSGGFEKFETPHLRGSIPYGIRYADMVATVLAATGGTHCHIGPLSAVSLNQIWARLSAAGISTEAFVHISFVPSLRQALLDLGVDVYLGSMPKGGGRSTIEAMAAGIPLLLHRNYRSAFFSDPLDAYPEAWSWRNLKELGLTLGRLTPALLSDQARHARNWYLRRHTPEAFAYLIKLSGKGEGPPEPPRPIYQRDALQFFLDRMQR